MHKLNGIVMMPNQDPDTYLTEVFPQRDELEDTDESFTEARILDLILEDLSDEYKPIRFAAERDPKILLRKIETTVRNIYANNVTFGGNSTFPRGKGRESAMMAYLGFKESCDYCKRPATKTSGGANFCVSLAGNHYLRAARQGSPGFVYTSLIFIIWPTAVPNSNSVATAGMATTPSATTSQ